MRCKNRRNFFQGLEAHLSPDAQPANLLRLKAGAAAGETVRRVRATDGAVYEVVTDAANRIVRSSRIP